MEPKKRHMANLLFAILFSLAISVVMADEKDVIVNAGNDQTVNAGDIVQLSGNIEFRKDEDDDHKKKKRKKKRKHKHGKGHHDKHDHDKHDKHEKDDDLDDIIISWTQSAGHSVTLVDDNTLTPSFTAPLLPSDEVLVFTLTASDDDGELIASDNVSVTVNMPAIPLSSLSARITSVNGTVLQGVTINVLSDTNGQSVVSDASGMIAIELNADSAAVLQLKAPGYADQVVPVKAPAANGSMFLDITMIARGAVQSFSAASNAVLTGADGASVTVNANSFVDANGAAVTGNIDLTITPVDVSRPASLAAFPGEFSGVPEGDTTDSPIISMGTVEFEFTQNGLPVNLAPGMTAEVLIPIYIDTYQDGTTISVGDTIPLWSLNEDTGIWTQEGVGTVISSGDSPTGLAMQAAVSHFSWWNCDVSMNAAQAIVTVFGPEAGTAVIRARTAAEIGWRPDTVDTVAAVGLATLPLYIPSNGETCFWAEITYISGAVGSTPETCITAAPGSLNTVDLVAPGPAPVNITTTPADTAGVLNVTAHEGYASRVIFRPTSYETTVNYSVISGSLPPGLSLNAINSNRAEIAGTVTASGNYSAVIQATDADGFTDTVTVNYSVVTGVPAPALQQPIIFLSYFALPASFDLNDYNSGGLVGAWSLPGLPTGVVLDPVLGTVTISNSCIFFNGPLTATNASGSSTTTLYLEDGTCF